MLELTGNGERIIAGLGHWERFESGFDSPMPIELAASAAWQTPTELVVFMCQAGSPTAYELTATFSGDEVAVAMLRLHTFLPPEGPTFTARR